ncbi:MAG: glutaredoxin family protein [Pirellulales bacterium]|jgi:glutaredoxin
MPDTETIVYTRAGCHLCDDAISLLKRHGFDPKTIDIDQDEALQQKFTECVPVVEIDGKIRFRGIVNEMLLKRILNA